MTNENTYYRHGDLLFIKVNEIPKDFITKRKTPKKHKRGVVIAEGEQTGHHHTIEQVEEYYDYQFRGGRISFVKIDKPVKLEHEEHGTIVLEPGTYQVNFQRELNWENLDNKNNSLLDEATRVVRD